MGRSEITTGLSALLEQHLDKQTCIYGSEVSIEPLGRCRPDYLSVSASFGKFADVSSIERAEVTVYEIKSCLADFKSGNGLNDVGDDNWLVMPYETYMKIVESEGKYSIGGRWSIAYPYPIEHGRVPDIANLPKYTGQVDGWKLYWGIHDLSRKTRPMPIMVYLWALLHSVKGGEA